MCVIILFVVLVLQFYLLNIAPEQLDRVFLSFSLIVDVFLLVIFYVGLRKTLATRWFNGFSLFLLSYCIVHFQSYVEYLFKLLADSSDLWYDQRYVCKACATASIGLSILCVTYIIVYYYYSRREGKKSQSFSKQYSLRGTRENPTEKVFQFVDTKLSMNVLLSLLWVCFILYCTTAGLSYFSGGYGSGTSSPNTFIGIFYKFFLFLYLISMASTIRKQHIANPIKQYLKSLSIYFYVFVLVFVGLVASSGDRGPIISLFCSILVGCVFASSKSPRAPIVIPFGVGLIIFIVILGNVRGSSSTGEGNLQKVYSTISTGENVCGDRNTLTSELAGSIKTWHIAVKLKRESVYDGNGEMIASEVINLFPIVGSRLSNLFFPSVKGPSVYITQYINGEYVGAGHGMGCTTLIDFYLDFGGLGVILVCIVIGFTYGQCDHFLYSPSNNPYVNFAMFYFVTMSYYLGRSFYLLQLKNAILLCVILYIFSSYVLRNKKVNYVKD